MHAAAVRTDFKVRDLDRSGNPLYVFKTNQNKLEKSKIFIFKL